MREVQPDQTWTLRSMPEPQSVRKWSCAFHFRSTTGCNVDHTVQMRGCTPSEWDRAVHMRSVTGAPLVRAVQAWFQHGLYGLGGITTGANWNVRSMWKPSPVHKKRNFLSLVREIVGLGSAGGGSEGKKAKAGKTERRLREAREERQALEEGSEE